MLNKHQKINILKILRTSRYKTQQEAADAVGVSRAWYGMIEHGRLIPTGGVCGKLESVFGLPIDVLLSEASVEKLINDFSKGV